MIVVRQRRGQASFRGRFSLAKRIELLSSLQAVSAYELNQGIERVFLPRGSPDVSLCQLAEAKLQMRLPRGLEGRTGSAGGRVY
jgi:hypothetical protein